MQKVQPKPTSRALQSILQDKCLTVLFILLVLLGAFIIQTGSASAASTSAMRPMTGYCSNPAPHCYSEAEWPGDITGAYTDISPYGSMSCRTCASGTFIDNEMWFSDTTSSQCVAVGACWVEAGISTYTANAPHNCNPGYASTCVFWADNRPNGGSYHEWSLWTIGPDGVNLDPWGFDVEIQNYDEISASGSDWEVLVSVYQNNNFYLQKLAISTANPMTANDIEVGSELSAPSGASAGTTDLMYNQWRDSSGNFRYQTASPQNPGNGPEPNGQWCWCSSAGGMQETWD